MKYFSKRFQIISSIVVGEERLEQRDRTNRKLFTFYKIMLKSFTLPTDKRLLEEHNYNISNKRNCRPHLLDKCRCSTCNMQNFIRDFCDMRDFSYKPAQKLLTLHEILILNNLAVIQACQDQCEKFQDTSIITGIINS